MNKKRIIVDIVLAIVIFFGAQMVCSFICIAANLIANATSGDVSPDQLTGNAVMGTMGWILALSNAICIVLILLLKRFDVLKGMTFKGCSWRFVPIVAVAAVLGIFSLDLMEEYLNLPNMLERDMINIISTVEGTLAVAVLGPVAEELIFRGVICGSMLRNGAGPWPSILISAFIFGLIHINPAQVPFAMAMGVILGILYYKTGSLVPSILIHVVNNTIAVLVMKIYSDQPDITFREILGDPVAASIMAAGLIVSVFLFIKYWKTKQ